MKEDLIQTRSSLVIKSHTVLGDLLTILLVISIYKSQSTNNACQSIQLYLQIRAGTIVPSLLVFVLVFTTSTVWFGLSCWKTKRWPRSSFAADCLSCALSSSHILLHDSQFQTHWSSPAAWCLTAGMVSLGVCGLCDQSAPISSNLVKEHICSMHHFSQGSPSITSVWLFLGLQSFTDSKLG